MCTSLTKPPYDDEDRIRLECRVSSIQQKKSGGFGEATRCHQRKKWSGFSGDFSDDSEELWCPEDDTTKGVWVALEALFEEERRSRWLKVGCAKHVRGQVGKRVMSCSCLCPESLRNSKANSLWYVARDARLWVPATQSKDMHVRRTFCWIRSGPNVTTGVVSMQRSHTSDLNHFSGQMLRRWLTKSSWKYDDVQDASTDRRPWKCFGWLRCQNPGKPRSNLENMDQGRKATASCTWVEHDMRTKWTWAEMTLPRFTDDYEEYDKALTLYPNKTSSLCAMQDMIKFVENDPLKMWVPVIKTGWCCEIERMTMTINVEELQKISQMDELRRQASWFKNPAFPSRWRMEARLLFEENSSKWFVREAVTSTRSEPQMLCWNTCTRRKRNDRVSCIRTVCSSIVDEIKDGS